MKCLLALLLTAVCYGQTSATVFTILPDEDAGAVGEIRMRERNANGVHYVGFKPPASVAANAVWEMPAVDGAASECLTTTGANVLVFGSCGGYFTRNSGAGTVYPTTTTDGVCIGCTDIETYFTYAPVLRSYKSTTPALMILEADANIAGQNAQYMAFSYSGSSTNNGFAMHGFSARGSRATPSATQSGDLLGRIIMDGHNGTAITTGGRANITFTARSTWSGTSNEADIGFSTTPSGSTTLTERWRINSAGHFVPITTDISDLGTSSIRVRTVYGGDWAGFTETATGAYVATQKLDLYDSGTGSALFWDIRASITGASPGSRELEIRDNAGTSVLKLQRSLSGATTDDAIIDLDLYPTGDNTRDLGASGRDWKDIYFQTSLIQNGTTRINSSGDGIFTDGTFNSDVISNNYKLVSGTNANVQANWIPWTANAYDLGTPSVTWRDTYTESLTAGSSSAYFLAVSGSISLFDGTNTRFLASVDGVVGVNVSGTTKWSISTTNGTMDVLSGYKVGGVDGQTGSNMSGCTITNVVGGIITGMTC